MAPIHEAIEREAARARQAIEEMAPGGFRERARLELAEWTASARIAAEQEAIRYAIDALTGARQIAFSQLATLHAVWARRATAEQQMMVQREAAWLEAISNMAGSAFLAIALAA